MSSLPSHRQMSQGQQQQAQQQQQQQQQQPGFVPMMMPNYSSHSGGMMSPYYVMDQNNQIHFMNPQLIQIHQAQQAMLYQQIQAQRQIQYEQQQRLLFAQQQQMQQRLQAGEQQQQHHGHNFKNLRINPLFNQHEDVHTMVNDQRSDKADKPDLHYPNLYPNLNPTLGRSGIPGSLISSTNATASSKQTDSGFQSGASSMNEAARESPIVNGNVHMQHMMQHQQQQQLLLQEQAQRQIHNQMRDQSIIAMSTLLPTGVPKPLNPRAATNDPSEVLPDLTEQHTETQSMIIEAGSDALRLDVALGNDGRAISATVVQVDKWITNERQASREAKSKEGEDENDGYKTEDEVEMAFPTRKTKTHDRIVTHDDLNRKVAELSKSCISNDMATLHSISSLNRTRTRGKLNRSVSHSLSQRRYKNNPGGKTRKNRPIPPESEPVTEDFDNLIETPPVPCAPQPTPVDPISESELPSAGTNAGNTPRKATRQTSLAVDQEAKDRALLEETMNRLCEHVVENKRKKAPKVRQRAPSKSAIKCTGAAQIAQSRASREHAARRSLAMNGLPKVTDDEIYNSLKPKIPATGPSTKRHITKCDMPNNLHVSLQFGSKEEPSTDSKAKKSLGKRLKIFSTGWKSKQRKAEVAADASERLRSSGRQMTEAFKDPAILQSKTMKTASSSKLDIQDFRAQRG